MNNLERMWVNQPSVHQFWHCFHGENVLAEPRDPNSRTVRVWFTRGDVISMEIPTVVLSMGWRKS